MLDRGSPAKRAVLETLVCARSSAKTRYQRMLLVLHRMQVGGVDGEFVLWHYDPADDVGDASAEGDWEDREHNPEDPHQRHVDAEVAGESGANAA
jgi:hypothetical protein